jgi:hypothetical protein
LELALALSQIELEEEQALRIKREDELLKEVQLKSLPNLQSSALQVPANTQAVLS